MAVAIRSNEEIECVRNAGAIVGRVLKRLSIEAVPGVTTAHLAQISDDIIAQANAIPLFKGVPNPGTIDFPSSICASINEELVHGIPGDRQLKAGDIVSIDCGAKYKGYCADAATTVMVGPVSKDAKKLVEMTRQLLNIAIDESKPGVLWSYVAGKMQVCAENAGYGVVRDYVGHGIGRKMHEEPKLPNYVSNQLMKNDLLLRKGMILAVEPMLNIGSHRVKTLKDGWTVVTADGTLSAHSEHTIAILDDRAEILTLPNDDEPAIM